MTILVVVTFVRNWISWFLNYRTPERLVHLKYAPINVKLRYYIREEVEENLTGDLSCM